MNKILILVLLFLLPALSQAASLTDQLGFADSLAAEGDHYRAITEYKRFIFTRPDSQFVPRARLSIATSLLAGQRWQEADDVFETLFTLHPTTREATVGRILYADSAYDRGAFSTARERFRTLRKKTQNAKTINYANFRIGWTFLEQNRARAAGETFDLLPPDTRQALATQLEQFKTLPQKSPRLAAALSVILPGGGQAYTGRYRQAATAFLLNGVFILGALEAFDNNNNVTGGILLFFELGWYGGNIYNATNNAYKYNQRIRHDFMEQMRERIKLQAGLVGKVPLLGLSYRF